MLEVILGIIRHLLTAGGGVLVSNGILEAGQVETAVGAVLALVGIVWSVWDKKKAK